MKRLVYIFGLATSFSGFAMDKKGYDFEKDFFVDSPNQEKFQRWAYGVINQRLAQDMDEIDLSDEEDLKTRPLYQVEAKKAGIALKAESLCNIYVAGRDPFDKKFLRAFAQKYNQEDLQSLNDFFDGTAGGVTNDKGNPFIIISNSASFLDKFNATIVRAILTHEFTHVDQILDRRILDILSGEIGFGKKVTKAMHTYLDLLTYEDSKIPYEHKLRHNNYFQQRYHHAHANILNESEAELNSIKYAKNPEVLQSYFQMHRGVERSFYYPSVSALTYYAQQEVWQRQRAPLIRLKKLS